MEIYLIENLVNNKKYIGLTTKTSEKRFKEHLWVAETNDGNIKKNAIHRAIKKYGKDNFKLVVIEKCDTLNELFVSEKKWINHYKSFGPKGYNETAGGEGNPGWVMSEKRKDFLRKLRIGTKHSEEAKIKMSLSRKGKKFSEKHKKSLSEAQKGPKNHRYGKTFTAEQKTKRSKLLSGKLNPFYGKQHSTQTKQKLSEKNKGRFSGNKNPAARKCKINDKIYETGKELRLIEGINLNKFYSLLKKGIITYEDYK